MAPTVIKRVITVKICTSKPKKETFWLVKKEAKENITGKSVERKTQKVAMIPSVKATSLIRFTTKALMAALLA